MSNGRDDIAAYDTAYNEQFATYYDVLTGHKDYAAELEALKGIIADRSPGGKKLFDVGCGVGRHAGGLHASGFDVTAVDTSPHMIEQARKLNPGPQYAVAGIESAQDSSFHVCCSLFNVVNCLPSLDAFARFVDEAYRALRPGGLFLFESWNLIPVCMTPPVEVVRQYEWANRHITRRVVPHADFPNQHLELLYEVEITGKSSAETASFRVRHRLFLYTVHEVFHILDRAGFRNIECMKALPETGEADDSDRLLCYVCRKP